MQVASSLALRTRAGMKRGRGSDDDEDAAAPRASKRPLLSPTVVSSSFRNSFSSGNTTTTTAPTTNPSTRSPTRSSSVSSNGCGTPQSPDNIVTPGQQQLNDRTESLQLLDHASPSYRQLLQLQLQQQEAGGGPNPSPRGHGSGASFSSPDTPVFLNSPSTTDDEGDVEMGGSQDTVRPRLQEGRSMDEMEMDPETPEPSAIAPSSIPHVPSISQSHSPHQLPQSATAATFPFNENPIVSSSASGQSQVRSISNSNNPKASSTRRKSTTPYITMGFRADCEKCRNRVPGHYSHII